MAAETDKGTMLRFAAVLVAWWVDRGRLAKELDLLKEPAHLTPQRTLGGVN
jgi:hypothetical protein